MSRIKLKKSSVAGRVPSASDMEYGEVAINIADGKLYFKNSSNTIQSFHAGSFVDSASVLGLIDSAYIQARQLADDPGLDSAEINALIADGLQSSFSRILVNGQFDVVADSTQDGLTFEAGNNISIVTTPNDDTITFSSTAIGADSVRSIIDSNYVDVRLPTRAVTLTDNQSLSNKTLIAPAFGDSANSPVFSEIRFANSTIMKFNQMYTGASSGSYFTNGEYQKVVTITPTSAAENYQVVGRITAQNANETHTVYFNAALRSNTLPNLDFTVTYNEEYNGNRYLDPLLWTKETTTAGFIFAFQTLRTIYGTVTVDFEVIPRNSSLLGNVVTNTVQNSEQSSVDTGFTSNAMTRTHAIIGNNVRLGAYTFPTADGNTNQVLGTNGSGTLQFVNQTSGMDSASTIGLVDSAYVRTRETSSFGTVAVTGVGSTIADQSNDTLNLTAGTNITMAVDTSTDTITINSTASGSSGNLDFGSIASPAGFTLDLGAI